MSVSISGDGSLIGIDQGLNVVGVVTATTISVGSGTSISSPSSNVLTLGTNNAERVRIDSSGRLGIGTNNPLYRLSVFGSAVKTSADGAILAFSSNDATNPFQLVFQRSASTDTVPVWSITSVEQNVAYRAISLQPNGGNTLIGMGGGNLGIGTDNPGTKLDVVGGTIRSRISGGTPIFYLNNGTTQHSIQNDSGVLGFYNDGTNVTNITNAGLFQFNSGYGSVATAYACRAWVNFNGGDGSRRGSGNVTSVSRSSTGNYTVNFTNAMPDGNFATVIGMSQGSSQGGVHQVGQGGPNLNSANYSDNGTTSVKIVTGNPSSSVPFDVNALNVAIFR